MIQSGDARRFETLLEHLRAARGIDLGAYKRPTLRRRVQKRMQTVGIASLARYRDHLEIHPEEYDNLLDAILINVTSFFRDPPAWDYLAAEIIPKIVDGSSDRPIRLCSVGCASGEEAYTLTMLFTEALGADEFRRRVKVYATDVDEGALNAARQAGYSDSQVKEVPAHLLEKYFESHGDRHVFRSDLRRAVIFGRQDVTRDASISRLDLLTCRNTLMYFNSETQARILSRFHFALKNTGFLFLGRAEMLVRHSTAFTPVSMEWRVYAKAPGPPLIERARLMAEYGAVDGGTRETRQSRVREMAFDAGESAELVVDARGVLALINERARTLFNLTSADVGRPFADLTPSRQPVDLRSHLDQVFTQRSQIKLDDLEWLQPSGDALRMAVRILPLVQDGGILLAVSISYRDVTDDFAIRAELHRAQQELETACQALQSTNEELETTNEELQSTIEELETTNEELQATNEELETMNEELQATNEEQRTLNEQLHQRSRELDRLNVHLNAILTGIRTAIVVTDADLRVEIWNPGAENLWGRRAAEVLGKKLCDVDIECPMERLEASIRTCLGDKPRHQEARLPATNRRGRAITCHVMLTPLLGLSGGVQGVILLMDECSPD